MNRLIGLMLFLATSSVLAVDASDFSDMEGWTIIAVTTVRDEFEGCDYDKRIQLDNGWALTCSEYSYSYAYRPDATIFTKAVEFRGRAYWMVRALIDEEFYEMQPILAKAGRPKTP